MSRECAVNAARHEQGVFRHTKWFLDWHLTGFGFQFAELVPSGWACPPPNSVAVLLLASCSLSCVLGGRNNVALLKGILGFTGAMG